MRKTCLFTGVFLAFILLSGCDHVYQVAFEVQNTSDHRVVIESQFRLGEPDTSVISHGATLILVEDSRIGATTEQYLDLLDTIPFLFMAVYTTDSIPYTLDPLDIEQWQKHYPLSKNGAGKVVLRLFNDDFNE